MSVSQRGALSFLFGVSPPLFDKLEQPLTPYPIPVGLCKAEVFTRLLAAVRCAFSLHQNKYESRRYAVRGGGQDKIVKMKFHEIFLFAGRDLEGNAFFLSFGMPSFKRLF